MRERECEGGDGWVRVKHRKFRPFFERSPVRQPYYPSHSRTPYPSSLQRSVNRCVVNGRTFVKQSKNTAWRDKWLRLKTQNTISFLVRNFPIDCSSERLRLKLEEAGNVVDFFQPTKLDRMGKPFGFVRFEAKYDENKLLRRLNDIWIGTYKIRALLLRYERRRHEAKEPGPSIPIPKESLRNPNRSFAEIMTTKDTSDSGQNIANLDKPLHFKTREEETRWLNDCLTGVLKQRFSWEEYGEELQEECGDLLNIRYMGDNVVLISNKSGKSGNDTTHNMDEWFKHWFEWTRPWSLKDVSHKRLVLTRWFGVPLHV